KLNNKNITSTLHILSKQATAEVESYKKYIIKRCKEFDIPYEDKVFNSDSNNDDVLAYTDYFEDKDAFILLQPFGSSKEFDDLRKDIKLKDIDGFTFQSLGKSMTGDLNSLPATPKAIINFLNYNNISIKEKRIVIANNTNLIGLPLASYCSKHRAYVTVLNSAYPDPHKAILGSDIFISAIGRANYYVKDYFKDGQVLIDVGTSVVNGKIVGDINYDQLEDLDVKVLTSKKGIGSITTLTLLESLID
ncbi:bifunctional 5,10-methylenetetrahydrofolate dehydrogenase/5,10-methenyltetrahydrofolate cyclohydrolase, partial [uncultured Anaerococcus sp.]